MNIIKIQDQLKGVPDQALVGYVQNPSGQVPTYLALAELQRRKDMRAKYQANKPEDKTVAEDLVEEVEPGVMGLPAGRPMAQAMQPPPEMPMEQMAQGGLTELDVGDMYDEANYANGGIVAFADRGYVNPALTEEPEENLSWWERQKRAIAKDKARREGIAMEENLRRQEMFGPKGGYVPKVKPAMTDKEVQQKAVQDQITNSIIQDTGIKASDLPAVKSTGQGGLPTLNIPGELTIDQAMENRKKAMELAGVPTDFYSKQAEELAKDKATLASDKEKAGWLALAQAGFGMAGGKSPYAVQNIAEGAKMGLEQYGKDVKDIKAEQRLLRQADQKLAEAQYLQQRGDAEGAMKKISERENLIQDYKKMQYSGAVSLQAARIAKESDYKDYMARAERNPKFYTKVDGKPVFDFEKAHQSYWLSKGTGGAKTGEQAYKDYLEGKMPNVPEGLKKDQFLKDYWSSEGSSTAGWGDLTVSK